MKNPFLTFDVKLDYMKIKKKRQKVINIHEPSLN